MFDPDASILDVPKLPITFTLESFQSSSVDIQLFTLTEFITDLRANIEKSNSLSNHCHNWFGSTDMREMINILNTQLELVLILSKVHNDVSFLKEGFSPDECDRWEKEMGTIWQLAGHIRDFSLAFGQRLEG